LKVKICYGFVQVIMDTWRQRELFEYTRRGDISGVMRLVKQRIVYVNTTNILNQTPLYIACENGDTAVARYLLDNGAYVWYGRTKPLIPAVRYNHYDCVKLLLERDADVNCHNLQAESSISVALRNHPNNIWLILLLLQYGAIPSTSFDDDITVKLLKNAKAEHANAVEKLIRENFIILTSKNTYLAALDFAFRHGSVQAAKKIPWYHSYSLIKQVHIPWYHSYSRIKQVHSKDVYYSAKNNCPDILSKLLEKTVDINALTEGQTALCAACREGHEYVVRLLLDNGADPNVPNDIGTTALHFAVDGHRHTSTAKMLLSAGADIDASDRDGASALFTPCARGKSVFVKLLLSRGANPNIGTVGPHIHTWYPIHAACRGLHYDAVKLLLEYNADVNLRDEFGESALHYAVSMYSTDSDKRTDLVQLLHDAGANVNAASEKGETPLYIACSKGLESTVMKMLECGAKVDGISGKKRPLNVACRNGHLSMVQVLLTNGANPNLLEERDESRRYSLPRYGQIPDKSPLIEACLKQNVKLVEMLLEHGADPNLASSSDLYPLFVAVDKGNSDIITLLLIAGANVNAVNDKGKSVLCLATENVIDRSYGRYANEIWNKLSTVRLLLKHGADVNIRKPEGLSPLYLAVNALTDAQGWEYRAAVTELLQLMVEYGSELRDSSYKLDDSVYLQALDTLTLRALATYNGEVKHKFIVELCRAGAVLPLLVRCCVAVASIPRRAKSLGLCQAAVMAGHMPSDEELRELQLEAAEDHSSGHQIQQLVNWLNEDKQQVPSLQRQCRVVIRRQLSAAVHFQSILPAINKLPLPTALKLYLKFDGPFTEVDLNVRMPKRP